MKIIPCLDVKGGKVVKGVNFVNLKDIGDPVKVARFYSNEGADELVFLDIAASEEERDIIIDLIKDIDKNIDIPFTVGGGIKNIEDIERILKAGANKVSINSQAIKNPKLIQEASKKFGKETIVIAIDGKLSKDKMCWDVMIKGGKENTGIDVLQWAKEAEKLGAGELLITSLEKDGTKDGYDIPLLKKVKEVVNIPVIASGGCGKLQDFQEVLIETDVEGALAASLLHYREATIKEIKGYLKNREIDFSKGLVPAIIQDFSTNEVLMLGYVDEEAFKRTVKTKTTWFWSRSREKYWNKGETSGNYQNVKEIKLDCDRDTLLIKVEQIGVACHTGERTCFFKKII